MTEYKIDKHPNNHKTSHGITKDGHMMFLPDVIKDLQRLSYLEKLIKIIGGTPELEKLANKCHKCGERKHSICDVACSCWMLETGKITQQEYDKIILSYKSKDVK